MDNGNFRFLHSVAINMYWLKEMHYHTMIKISSIDGQEDLTLRDQGIIVLKQGSSARKNRLVQLTMNGKRYPIDGFHFIKEGKEWQIR